MTAILLNPPLKEGHTTSFRNVHIAAEILGFYEVEIANLFPIPTKDLPALDPIGVHRSTWVAARPSILRAMQTGDELLLAWGLGGLTGDSRKHFKCQLGWVLRRASELGHTSMWTVGGAPRHPSRWRQFVGPGRGLFDGSTFDERLASALEWTPSSRILPGRIPSCTGRE